MRTTLLIFFTLFSLSLFSHPSQTENSLRLTENWRFLKGDLAGVATAMTEEMIRTEMKMMKEMGVSKETGPSAYVFREERL